MGELVPFRRRDLPEPRPRSAGSETEQPAPGIEQPAPDTSHLWRHQVGRELREERQRRQLRLVDVAERAGLSAQYLSEIERGRKEPSSEVLQAALGALDLQLIDLTARVTRRLAAPRGPLALAA